VLLTRGRRFSGELELKTVEIPTSILLHMLWTIAVVLIILWLLGYLGFPLMLGYYIHILLVVAIIVILIQLISGRRPL
jgi:hypothetical protein